MKPQFVVLLDDQEISTRFYHLQTIVNLCHTDNFKYKYEILECLEKLQNSPKLSLEYNGSTKVDIQYQVIQQKFAQLSLSDRPVVNIQQFDLKNKVIQLKCKTDKDLALLLLESSTNSSNNFMNLYFGCDFLVNAAHSEAIIGDTIKTEEEQAMQQINALFAQSCMSLTSDRVTFCDLVVKTENEDGTADFDFEILGLRTN